MTYKLNGKEVTREEFLEGREFALAPPMTSNTYTEHDPLVSDGCGVMKAQVSDTRSAIKHHGIQGASVLNNGQVRFTSRKARKEFLSMRGLNDQDGTYGD